MFTKIYKSDSMLMILHEISNEYLFLKHPIGLRDAEKCDLARYRSYPYSRERASQNFHECVHFMQPTPRSTSVIGCVHLLQQYVYSALLTLF